MWVYNLWGAETIVSHDTSQLTGIPVRCLVRAMGLPVSLIVANAKCLSFRAPRIVVHTLNLEGHTQTSATSDFHHISENKL